MAYRIGQVVRGKVWSGEGYGFQTPESFQQLKNEGAFKVGAKQLNRIGKSLKRFYEKNAPKVVKDVVKGYGDKLAKSEERYAQASETVRSQGGLGKTYISMKEAAEARRGKDVKALSDKTNIDPRLIEGGLTIAESIAEGKVGIDNLKLIAKGGAIKMATPSLRKPGPVSTRQSRGAGRPSRIRDAMRRRTPKGERGSIGGDDFDYSVSGQRELAGSGVEPVITKADLENPVEIDMTRKDKVDLSSQFQEESGRQTRRRTSSTKSVTTRMPSGVSNEDVLRRLAKNAEVPPQTPSVRRPKTAGRPDDVSNRIIKNDDGSFTVKGDLVDFRTFSSREAFTAAQIPNSQMFKRFTEDLKNRVGTERLKKLKQYQSLSQRVHLNDTAEQIARDRDTASKRPRMGRLNTNRFTRYDSDGTPIAIRSREEVGTRTTNNRIKSKVERKRAKDAAAAANRAEMKSDVPSKPAYEPAGGFGQRGDRKASGPGLGYIEQTPPYKLTPKRRRIIEERRKVLDEDVDRLMKDWDEKHPKPEELKSVPDTEAERNAIKDFSDGKISREEYDALKASSAAKRIPYKTRRRPVKQWESKRQAAYERAVKKVYGTETVGSPDANSPLLIKRDSVKVMRTAADRRRSRLKERLEFNKKLIKNPANEGDDMFLSPTVGADVSDRGLMDPGFIYDERGVLIGLDEVPFGGPESAKSERLLNDRRRVQQRRRSIKDRLRDQADKRSEALRNPETIDGLKSGKHKLDNQTDAERIARAEEYRKSPAAKRRAKDEAEAQRIEAVADRNEKIVNDKAGAKLRADFSVMDKTLPGVDQIGPKEINLVRRIELYSIDNIPGYKSSFTREQLENITPDIARQLKAEEQLKEWVFNNKLNRGKIDKGYIDTTGMSTRQRKAAFEEREAIATSVSQWLDKPENQAWFDRRVQVAINAPDSPIKFTPRVFGKGHKRVSTDEAIEQFGSRIDELKNRLKRSKKGSPLTPNEQKARKKAIEDDSAPDDWRPKYRGDKRMPGDEQRTQMAFERDITIDRRFDSKTGKFRRRRIKNDGGGRQAKGEEFRDGRFKMTEPAAEALSKQKEIKARQRTERYEEFFDEKYPDAKGTDARNELFRADYGTRVDENRVKPGSLLRTDNKAGKESVRSQFRDARSRRGRKPIKGDTRNRDNRRSLKDQEVSRIKDRLRKNRDKFGRYVTEPSMEDLEIQSEKAIAKTYKGQQRKGRGVNQVMGGRSATPLSLRQQQTGVQGPRRNVQAVPDTRKRTVPYGNTILDGEVRKKLEEAGLTEQVKQFQREAAKLREKRMPKAKRDRIRKRLDEIKEQLMERYDPRVFQVKGRQIRR